MSMSRLLVVALFVLSIFVAAGSPSSAGPISPRNPYRSYNISGVNYASMQWERTHRGQSNRSYRPWALNWRRR